MLKNIPSLISPELLKILAEMGHGDEIVLADRNFPASSIASKTIIGHELRFDGIKMPELLDAVTELFPLDSRVDKNVFYMTVGGDFKADIWETYDKILSKDVSTRTETLLKSDFYARSAAAYAVVITGEMERCANLILRKGVL